MELNENFQAKCVNFFPKKVALLLQAKSDAKAKVEGAYTNHGRDRDIQHVDTAQSAQCSSERDKDDKRVEVAQTSQLFVCVQRP